MTRRLLIFGTCGAAVGLVIGIIAVVVWPGLQVGDSPWTAVPLAVAFGIAIAAGISIATDRKPD